MRRTADFPEFLDPAGTGDREGDAPVGVHLALELLSSGGGELVVARAAILGGARPRAADPAFHQHALEGRVERSLLDAEHVARAALNRLRDLEAVQLAVAGDGGEDEHVEGAGRDRLALGARGLRHRGSML